MSEQTKKTIFAIGFLAFAACLAIFPDFSIAIGAVLVIFLYGIVYWLLPEKRATLKNFIQPIITCTVIAAIASLALPPGQAFFVIIPAGIAGLFLVKEALRENH